jgi:hypothetical protein
MQCDWLINWYLGQTLAVFQLYRGVNAICNTVNIILI